LCRRDSKAQRGIGGALTAASHQKIIQVCWNTVPIKAFNDPKKTPWEHLYDTMPLHLFPVGIAPGLDAWMEDSRRYNRLLNETLGMFNMVASHGMELQPYWKELVGKIIFFICRLKHCTNAPKLEQAMSYSKSSVMDSMPCVLHMHTLLIEKVMTLLFVIS
jgi:hypothetical protein